MQRLDERMLSLFGVSGGAGSASTLGSGCIGAIAREPNHTLHLRRQSHLRVSARSQSDLTLVVQSGGATHCNDDAAGTLNPSIAAVFEPGRIQIYVGSHNARVEAPYSLTLTPIPDE